MREPRSTAIQMKVSLWSLHHRRMFPMAGQEDTLDYKNDLTRSSYTVMPRPQGHTTSA